MKAKFISALLILGAGRISAQIISNDQLPQEVLNAFKTKFPTANVVSWVQEPNTNYEAKFTLAEKDMRAEFNKNGVWVETENAIKPNEVPPAVKKTVLKEKPGCRISDAEEIQSAKDGKMYEVGCSKSGSLKRDYRVTADGKLEKEIAKK